MTDTIPRQRRNPRRAYDSDGRELVPPTIGHLRAEGETTAAVFCETGRCRHHAILSTDAFPADLPFPDIKLRTRCSVCGGKDVRVMRDMVGFYARHRAAEYRVG